VQIKDDIAVLMALPPSGLFQMGSQAGGSHLELYLPTADAVAITLN